MAAVQGQGHVTTQSQQGLIAGDQYVATPSTPSQGAVNGNPQNKKKLIIIGVVAVLIIIAVIIAAVTIEFKGDDGYSSPSRWGWGDCGCTIWNSSFQWDWDQVCGMLLHKISILTLMCII